MEFPIKTTSGKEFIIEAPVPVTPENHYITYRLKDSKELIMKVDLNHMNDIAELYTALDGMNFQGIQNAASAL